MEIKKTLTTTDQIQGADDVLAALLIDAYKAFHQKAYNPTVTHVYSNFTNRGKTYSNTGLDYVVNVGTQYFVKSILMRQWQTTFFDKPKEVVVAEYQRVIGSMLNKVVDTTHIEELHDLGYLPVRLKGLPEGSLVPYQVPTLTITNTVSGFGWVTNMLETVLSSETWGISTSATTAFAYRKRFESEESLRLLGAIPFLCHDFSYRGHFGTQAASMSGFGHLCSFVGSDIVPAALFAERYYGAKIDKELVFASVDATEHSVMCSYGTEGELESLIHIITNVTPDGIVSIVSDTWDFWKLVTEYLPSIKDLIMSRDGTVVIRPDSGVPEEILCGKQFDTVRDDYSDGDFDAWCAQVAAQMDVDYREELDAEDPNTDLVREYQSPYGYYRVTYTPMLNRYDKKYYYVDNSNGALEECVFEKMELTAEDKGLVECLWETFGGTIQAETGLKLLDSHISAIYGDSITLKRQDEITKRLIAKGFVPNVVLGVGSFTYQYVTRDTHASAVKATDIQKGTNNHEAIFKDPKTDQSKKSAKGLLQVVKNAQGVYVLNSDVTPEEEQTGELEVIFEDGKLIKETTLNEIRERINSNF